MMYLRIASVFIVTDGPCRAIADVEFPRCRVPIVTFSDSLYDGFRNCGWSPSFPTAFLSFVAVVIRFRAFKEMCRITARWVVASVQCAWVRPMFICQDKCDTMRNDHSVTAASNTKSTVAESQTGAQPGPTIRRPLDIYAGPKSLHLLRGESRGVSRSVSHRVLRLGCLGQGLFDANDVVQARSLFIKQVWHLQGLFQFRDRNTGRFVNVPVPPCWSECSPQRDDTNTNVNAIGGIE